MTDQNCRDHRALPLPPQSDKAPLSGTLVRDDPGLSQSTAARNTQPEFHHLFHLAPVAYVLLDQQGVIVEANLAAACLLRKSHSNLVNQAFSNVLSEDEKDEFLPYLNNARDISLTHELQVSICDGNGKCKPVLLMCTAVRSHKSAELCYQLVIVDFERQSNAEKRLQKAKDYLERLAHHDPLTGLPNRMMFFDRLRSAMARCGRSNHKLAVLFFDIDGFKPINDTLGHATGDRLLCEIANRLRNHIRGEDTIARLGGDEFTIVLEFEDDPNDVVDYAHRIAHTIRRPIMIGEHEVHVTSSIGISLFPDHAASAEDLVRGADLAMYRSKSAGRDQVSLFATEQLQTLAREARLATDFIEALNHGQFELHYQPVVDAQQLLPWHVEALSRWHHPDLGTIMPGEFIPIAEKSGHILDFGEWLLRSASTQAREWLDQGLELPIAVNVSARQLRDPHFVKKIEEALKVSKLPAQYFELELTESELMTDHRECESILHNCKDNGICISIDDFGTGYSSLARLIDLPVTRLKIDRSFVSGIGQSRNAEAIIKAIIAMAHNLDLQVISEGIESHDQLSFLKRTGSDAVQGYLLSKPVPAAELPVVLQQLRTSEFQQYTADTASANEELAVQTNEAVA